MRDPSTSPGRSKRRVAAIVIGVGAALFGLLFAVPWWLRARIPSPTEAADLAVPELLDALVPELLTGYGTPGAAVAWIEGGEVVAARGYGVTDLESDAPITGSTAFNIGSISKVFAAWSALNLVDRGALDLDAPIEEYLTRWKLPPSDFDSSGVTARRILAHRAGLSLSGYPGFGPGDALPTLEESLGGATNGAGGVRLIAEPGEEWRYSGGGFTVLQLAIEEISGESFADFARRNVLRPIGMSASDFVITGEVEARLARPYADPRTWFTDPREVPMVHFTALAAAGMTSTLDDMVRFVQWWAPVPGPAGVEPGWRRSIASLAPDDESEYVLGHQVRRLGELVTVGHTGSNPGWMSHFQVAPATGDGFVVLTNGNGGFPVHNAIACHWIWRRAEVTSPEFCWIFDD